MSCLQCTTILRWNNTYRSILIKEVAKHPNIVGVKDSSTGNIESFLLAVRDTFNVMPGSANFFVNGLIMGAPGGVISLANVFPEITCQLYDLTVSKQYEEAFKLNERVIQLNKTVSGTGGVAAVKYAMDLAGLLEEIQDCLCSL